MGEGRGGTAGGREGARERDSVSFQGVVKEGVIMARPQLHARGRSDPVAAEDRMHAARSASSLVGWLFVV